MGDPKTRKKLFLVTGVATRNNSVKVFTYWPALASVTTTCDAYISNLGNTTAVSKRFVVQAP